MNNGLSLVSARFGKSAEEGVAGNRVAEARPDLAPFELLAVGALHTLTQARMRAQACTGARGRSLEGQFVGQPPEGRPVASVSEATGGWEQPNYTTTPVRSQSFGVESGRPKN
jgi:hypothetical protein